MDDTPYEWSCHASPFLQQQQQQQRVEAGPPTTPMRVASESLRPRASFDLDGVGTAAAVSIRSSKRPRLGPGDGAAKWWETSSTRAESRPDPDTFSEENVGFQSTWGLYKERGDGKDGDATRSKGAVAAGGVGCCTFRWPDSTSTTNASYSGCRDCSSGTSRSGRGCEGQLEQGESSTAGQGQGGGASAAHPSAMEVVAGGGGQESQMVGDHGCPVLGAGEDGEGGGASGAGGDVVISSGFGAGGFPKHPWHQDQGGSCDDMLILYGSPS